eukprot:CAMPEP_0202920074 /NCGR_PEP_ID=MMETSP1392-20130828/76668_1 /ASSEMBLY_ACC=CAM_ASM_000868 /TAXON_ID=225041 /ORGANISM="Chlamydomonas chlamydogama, Strain SAG 11-48b" /LENGTH=32 /DNA_ID= /DNA_START= /DNA_END= /DNA_ORIENTATION=
MARSEGSGMRCREWMKLQNEGLADIDDRANKV